MRYRLLMTLVALTVVGCGCSCQLLRRGPSKATSDIPAVTGFDLQRYLGRWYEIARLPHRFERGLHFVNAEYTLRPDGRVTVLNSGIEGIRLKQITGVAKQPEVGTGALRVSFFRPFYGDYRIIELAPDYSWAIVTGSSRDYLWILARTPTLPPEIVQERLARLRSWGFAVDSLEYPKQ